MLNGVFEECVLFGGDDCEIWERDFGWRRKVVCSF